MTLMQLLTNENQILINFFNIFISIVEGFLFYETFSLVLHTQATLKKKFLFASIICITGTAVSIIPNDLLKDIISLTIFLLCVHFIFNQSLKNSFLALVVSYLGAIVSGFLAQTIFMFVFDMKLQNLTSIPIYYLSSCILSSVVWLVAILFIKFIRANKKISIFNVPLKNFIHINLALGIITIALESYLISVYTDLIPFKLTLMIVITLLVYFSISMYSIIRTNTLEKIREDLQNEILYNKTLTLLHDNIRSFRHDFNNIVQSIGGYISLNDMDGLKEYYKHLLDECQITNNLNLLNPETINNPSIYSILTNKYYIAEQKNVDMTFSIFTDLSAINFNIYEFSLILGILLDNAIEAAEETEERKVEVEFTSDNKKQLFIIRNSCRDSNISTTKIFEKGYSTKNRNSGIGLWKVHKILSKNTNLDLFTSVKDNVFSQQLELFYNKTK